MGSTSTRTRKKNIPIPSSPRHLSSSFTVSLPFSKADFSRLIAVISIAAAVAAACKFITTSLNQPPRPFCDTATSDHNDPFLGQLIDDCEPCPTNGVCYDGKLECIQGYRKHGKSCVEDGNFNEAAKKLSKWVEIRVCEAYAQFLCSGTGKCWVLENELFNNLDGDNMTDSYALIEAIYLPAKGRAMEFIHKLLETRRNSDGVKEFRCPELLADHYKSLSCKVRLWIIKHAVLLVLASALFMGFGLLASRAYKRYWLSVRAEQLYHEVCDVLEEKMLISRSERGDGEPWVVDSWLRDHLLSSKERKDRLLWKKVEELVAEDSRVDQYPKLVKGEAKVLWEWQVEGSLSSSAKRKKNEGSAQKLKGSFIEGSVPILKEFFQDPNAQQQISSTWCN